MGCHFFCPNQIAGLICLDLWILFQKTFLKTGFQLWLYKCQLFWKHISVSLDVNLRNTNAFPELTGRVKFPVNINVYKFEYKVRHAILQLIKSRHWQIAVVIRIYGK